MFYLPEEKQLLKEKNKITCIYLKNTYKWKKKNFFRVTSLYSQIN